MSDFIKHKYTINTKVPMKTNGGPPFSSPDNFSEVKSGLQKQINHKKI